MHTTPSLKSKLSLNKETLRSLTDHQTEQVNGGTLPPHLVVIIITLVTVRLR
jgi:hypothetical protein